MHERKACTWRLPCTRYTAVALPRCREHVEAHTNMNNKYMSVLNAVALPLWNSIRMRYRTQRGVTVTALWDGAGQAHVREQMHGVHSPCNRHN